MQSLSFLRFKYNSLLPWTWRCDTDLCDLISWSSSNAVTVEVHFYMDSSNTTIMPWSDLILVVVILGDFCLVVGPVRTDFVIHGHSDSVGGPSLRFEVLKLLFFHFWYFKILYSLDHLRIFESWFETLRSIYWGDLFLVSRIGPFPWVFIFSFDISHGYTFFGFGREKMNSRP